MGPFLFCILRLCWGSLRMPRGTALLWAATSPPWSREAEREDSVLSSPFSLPEGDNARRSGFILFYFFWRGVLVVNT